MAKSSPPAWKHITASHRICQFFLIYQPFAMIQASALGASFMWLLRATIESESHMTTLDKVNYHIQYDDWWGAHWEACLKHMLSVISNAWLHSHAAVHLRILLKLTTLPSSWSKMLSSVTKLLFHLANIAHIIIISCFLLILPTVFSPQDARVRYYALESLFNIAKVTREGFMPFFADTFETLFRLSADMDSAVQLATTYLDNLLKVSSNNILYILHSDAFLECEFARFPYDCHSWQGGEEQGIWLLVMLITSELKLRTKLLAKYLQCCQWQRLVFSHTTSVMYCPSI